MKTYDKIKWHLRFCRLKWTPRVFFLFTLFLSNYGTLAQPLQVGEPKVLVEIPGVMTMNPQWSPDGKFISFTTSNNNGLWLANTDGTGVRLLTTDEGIGFGYSWSPDGKFILGRPSITVVRSRQHQVKVFNVDGSGYEILLPATRSLLGLPQWTKGGERVIFVNNRQAEAAVPKALAQKAETVHSQAIYGMLDKLMVFDSHSKSSKSIASFDGRVLFNISPSPEGNKVSFQVQGLGLYVIDADGANLRHLGFGEKASWLPGERYVVVDVTRDDGHNVTGSDLYRIDLVTGEEILLTGHTDRIALRPSVSPCGRKVAFNDPSDGKIYVLDIR